MSALWRPGNALHHMFMFPQLSFALFGSHDPHAHRLVVGATGDEGAVLVGPHHADPLPVACEGLHAVAEAQRRAYVTVSSRKAKVRGAAPSRVRTQLPLPTFSWFCPLRRKQCGLHLA